MEENNLLHKFNLYIHTIDSIKMDLLCGDEKNAMYNLGALAENFRSLFKYLEKQKEVSKNLAFK